MKSHKLIKNPKISGKCVLVLFVLIFCLIMSAFVIIEIRNSHNDNSTVLRIIRNSDSEKNSNATKFLLINFKQKSFIPEDLAVAERVVRQTVNATRKTSNNYYEEQQPVVVHSESVLPVMDYQQNPENGASQNNARYDEENQHSYYNDNDSAEDYFDSNYYDGDFKHRSEVGEFEEGRSAQQEQSDFNQWHYKPWPLASSNRAESTETQKESENQFEMKQRQPPYANYADEVMDYEYPMGFVRRQPTNEPKTQFNQKMQKEILQQTHARIPERLQRPQQRLKQKLQEQRQQLLMKPQQTEAHKTANPIQPINTEFTLLTVLKGLKTMWDIYQAFSSAWNAIAEHRQKQENMLREKLKQQQRIRIRVNSKKPPIFSSNSTVATIANPIAHHDTDKNNKDKSTTNSEDQNSNKIQTTKAKIRTTKVPKPKTTTTKPPEITSLKALEKIEQRRRSNLKGVQNTKIPISTLRERRASKGDVTDADSVDEGRYIKGDPLKGYYDFVITEGSYKFWAIFQTGTAILIIYSVFAAIYYSKVNPLVSDYDYTDYLGGARSLSEGDLDFVDDDGVDQKDNDSKKTSKSWYTEILPKAGHSLEFILNAIDKLPVDHEQAELSDPRYVNNEENENDQETYENFDLNDYDYTTKMPY